MVVRARLRRHLFFDLRHRADPIETPHRDPVQAATSSSPLGRAPRGICPDIITGTIGPRTLNVQHAGSIRQTGQRIDNHMLLNTIAWVPMGYTEAARAVLHGTQVLAESSSSWRSHGAESAPLGSAILLTLSLDGSTDQ